MDIPRRRNRIDFIGRLGEVGTEVRRIRLGFIQLRRIRLGWSDRVWEEMAGIMGYLWGCCRNLMQWKLTGIY